MAVTPIRISNKFWKPGNNNTLVEAADADVALYLKDELGLSASNKYTTAALTMLKDPTTQFAAYDTDLTTAMAKEAKAYKKDVTRIAKLGLPEERARAIALENSRARVQAELKLLDLEFPMARNDSLLATAAVKGGGHISLTNPFKASSDAPDQAKFEKYRAAYKAKKGKKGGK